MSMVGFPLLLIPLALFNVMVFLMPGVSFSAPVFTLTLMSGVSWAVTLGDILLAAGILLLMLEVIKGGRPGGKYLTDHLLSLLVLGGAAAEFVLLPQFGNSIYFMLTALAFVDFVSGIALRTRRAKRVVPAAAPVNETHVREPERAEPRVDAPPASPAPHSKPAVTSPPHPEPVVIEPSAPVVTAANDSSPQVPSPGLQPPSEPPPSEPRPSTDTPPRQV